MNNEETRKTEETEKIEKKKDYSAVAAGLLFVFAVWCASLAVYLRNSMLNYQPAPNEPQESDMVSAFAMLIFFVCAVLFLLAALYALIIYFLRRRRLSSADN